VELGAEPLLTREVRIAGIVPEPGEDWMKQVARNLTNASVAADF